MTWERKSRRRALGSLGGGCHILFSVCVCGGAAVRAVHGDLGRRDGVVAVVVVATSPPGMITWGQPSSLIAHVASVSATVVALNGIRRKTAVLGDVHDDSHPIPTAVDMPTVGAASPVAVLKGETSRMSALTHGRVATFFPRLLPLLLSPLVRLESLPFDVSQLHDMSPFETVSLHPRQS